VASIAQPLIDEGNAIRAEFFKGLKIFCDGQLGEAEGEVPKLGPMALQYGENWTLAHVSEPIKPAIAIGFGFANAALSAAAGPLTAVQVAHIIDLRATVDAKLDTLGGSSSSSASAPATSSKA